MKSPIHLPLTDSAVPLADNANGPDEIAAYVLRRAGADRDRPGVWLQCAAGGLCVLAAAAAAVSFTAQYRLVYAARRLALIAGLEAVAALTGRRIITTRTEHITGQPVAELIHDALIRDWPELRRWVAQGRQFHDWLHRVTEQYLQWKESQSPGDLLRDTDLNEGRSKWEKERALPHEIADFLAASVRAERARAIRNRRIIVALAAATAVAVTAAAVAGVAYQRARRDEAAKKAETAVAVSRQLAVEALTQDSTDPYTARQLAVAATTVSGTPQARQTEAALLNEQRSTIITPDGEIHSVSLQSGRHHGGHRRQ